MIKTPIPDHAKKKANLFLEKITPKLFTRLKLNGCFHFAVGLFAFLYVFFRTGINPKRVVYPCQQVSIPIAIAWLVSIAAFFSGSYLAKKITKTVTVAAVSMGIIFAFCAGFNTADQSINLTPTNGELPRMSLEGWENPNPLSKLVVVNDLPPTSGSLAPANASVPDAFLSDPGMDALFTQLAKNGTHLYKTIDTPNGIIGNDDVVIVKCNFQWENRSGTNGDRVKGLIHRILKHPEGFTGEVMIIDNTQGPPMLDIGEDDNNADDKTQSILDVIKTFQAKGYPVSIRNLGYLNPNTVEEYSEGDMKEGFVYRPEESKLNYPKFTTSSGEYVSLRYGIYDPGTNTYDKKRMKIINFPVLKGHILAGATIAIKNWVGIFGIDHYGTMAKRYKSGENLHNEYFFGEKLMLPRLFSITFPDLTIVDATYTNAMNHSERSDLNATFGLFKKFDPKKLIHTNTLVASTDPCAASYYAAKYILHPHTDGQDRLDPFFDRTNPDFPLQNMQEIYIDNYKVLYYAKLLKIWTSYLSDKANLPCTINPDEMSVYRYAVEG